MGFFTRSKQNISPDSQKRETPDGQWIKCSACDEIINVKQLELHFWVCHKCNHHFRIGSEEYISLLIDEGSFKEFDKKMRSADPLNFQDTKKYSDRINSAIKKTGLNDAVRTGIGKIDGKKVSFACMDFKFVGGSMGSVVGEKIARAIDRAYEQKIPMILISQSGGARMMEAALSLMQMAKTSARLARLADAKLPYISILTDPTTGGTTASYAMLGDINIAEPNALIGFAGPRVIKETIGKDLPDGFQKSEFLLEHGFIDIISERKDLKRKLSQIIDYVI
ncbi:MAG: acetyl-CoA carboxylase carboxyl transferase subunit beta [Ignavibacteriales bacterium CG18_big_fil_WC_8_21_14_2_50_31_20]|nr:MAG: acetyl-CoA carboxylase carboxyl transferase subunit beta [Ignavibacteriales bacterium CG18_big_fil_WC_8_21_14_2_50_31_20]